MKSKLAIRGIVAAMSELKAGRTRAASALLEATVASRHFPHAMRVLKAVAEEVATPNDSFDEDLDAGQIGEDLRDELAAAVKRGKRVAAEADEDFDFESDVVAEADDGEEEDDSDDDAGDFGEDVTARRRRRFQANRQHASLAKRLRAARARR